MSKKIPTRKAKPDKDKGSYRHMLDLVASPRFEEIINRLLEETNACLAKPDCRHPIGRSKKKDWTEMELEGYLATYPHASKVIVAEDWWFPYKTNRNRRPTWDLICHIEVGGKAGLLIVEAKAHVGELKEQDKKKRPSIDKPRRMANDNSIRLRLCEASLGLTNLGIGSFRLSADHHYQLSNRLAYLHMLAGNGVPTVLMYLGVLDSPDWPDDPLKDSEHWKSVLKEHFQTIGPWEFVGKQPTDMSVGSMQMIVRDLSADAIGDGGS